MAKASLLPFAHEPVLLEPTLEALGLAPGALVVDGTLGGGGHSEAILERTEPGGRVVGLDRDLDAIAAAGERLARFGDRALLVHESFRDLDRALALHSLGPVDGVLLDLGVSSPQLDRAERGFRFASETAEAAPLDMRMDASAGPTAAELLARASEAEITDWLRRYGELAGAHRLAAAIVNTRREAPIETVADLLALIREARIGGGRKHNPATLVFQALRIAVNDELGALRDGLERALEALRPGGRIAVIAYHSLEDRLVKHRLREAAQACTCPRTQPVCSCGGRPALRLVSRRPIRPSDEEIARNPRARSARLRAAERLDAPLRPSSAEAA